MNIITNKRSYQKTPWPLFRSPSMVYVCPYCCRTVVMFGKPDKPGDIGLCGCGNLWVFTPWILPRRIRAHELAKVQNSGHWAWLEETIATRLHEFTYVKLMDWEFRLEK